MKKITSLLMTVVMLATMLSVFAVPASAEDTVTEYWCLDVGAGAYIDTGYVPTKDTRVVFNAEVNNKEAALFGTIWHDNNAGSVPHNYYVNSGGTTFGFGFGKNDASWSSIAVLPGRNTIELDDYSLIYGESKDTHNASEFSVNGNTMVLCGIHIDDWVQTFEQQHIRLYACHIYEGDEVVHNFVPARNGDKVGVYDRVDKSFHEKQGDGSMVPYSTRQILPEVGLPSGINNDGFIIDWDGTLTVSKDTTINARPAQSALLIDGNVTIEIKEGVTFTVNGGDADGMNGAGAGIEVPEGATLNITGKGTLIAKGGNAAAGENGGKGANGQGTAGKVSGRTPYMSTGSGGNGGNGGGGAGAGIGGRGGNGGAGGTGGAGVYSEQSTTYGWANGNAGSNGGNGATGGIGGKITVSDTLKGKVQGGFAFLSRSQGGGYGDKGYGRIDVKLIGLFYNEYVPFGGGGGGAGGNGYAAAGIGNGGPGGGGGGAGGSGLVIYRIVISKDAEDALGTGHAGLGGTGFVNGDDGLDQGEEKNTDELVAGAGGKGGVAGSNSVKGDKVVYLDDASRAADMKYRLDVNAGGYFDTGYVPTKDTRLVFDAEVNDKMAALFGVIWHDNNAGSVPHNYYVNSGGTSFGFGFGKNDAKWADDAPLSAGRHTVELDDYALKYDGVIKEKHKNTDFTVNGNSIYLCGINIDNVAQTFEEQFIRFYSCQIYEGETLVRDFIPTTVGNVAMLLDRKNGVLYENQGDGYIAMNPIEGTDNSSLAGSVFVNGGLPITVGITAAVVFGLGGFFLGTKKKKKKSVSVVESAIQEETQVNENTNK